MIINAGLNNFWSEPRPNPLALGRVVVSFAESMQKKFPQAKVFVALLPMTGHPLQETWVKTVNSVIFEFEKKGKIFSGPRFDKMEKDMLSEDGVHPNAFGYDFLTERVLRWGAVKGIW